MTLTEKKWRGDCEMEKKHVAKLIRHKEKIIRQLIDDLFWAAMGLALGFLFLLAVIVYCYM